MRLFALLYFLGCLPWLSANAQDYSNLRKKTIATQGMVRLDTLSIVPGSVVIQNTDSSYYSLDDISASLIWHKHLPVDSVSLIYRVFPFRLSTSVSRFSFDSIADNILYKAPVSRGNSPEPDLLFNFGKIDYNGSFGRSMSFGNNQDAVFNSEFNLQMNGYIGDSIHLAAALTDNNIPIQPQGTTQQLNDFDKILLQFSKPNWEINLGDIDLRTEGSYYLNFYKRLQGVSYMQKSSFGKDISNKTLVSGAIAKGKFARNILAVTEGNQGPYRLVGNNNELYFVVLAGTEKVYLDGQLLQRGEDRDYTIDYNAAEITFMPRHMITRDSRVQVEFEYADRNYLNSMFYVKNETRLGEKLRVTVSAYNNSDAKNSPINQTLDKDKIDFLRGIGDSIQNAFYPVAAIDTFSANAILYKKIDTTFSGTSDSVFVYSTNPDSAKYNLSFIQVGVNKGNYVPLLNGTNGKVYQWIQPVNGVPQGSFEPAEFLVTPKSQQILSVKGEYRMDSKTILTAELATSNTNNNTFSNKNLGDNKGFAGKATISRTEKWKSKNERLYTFIASGSAEAESNNFQTVETLRPVEFARDWGLALIPARASEKLVSLDLSLLDDKLNMFHYQLASYLRGDGYSGLKNIFAQKWLSQNGWDFDNSISYTTMSMPGNKGHYLKPSLNIGKTFRKLANYSLGAGWSTEDNEMKNIQLDSVLPVSFKFRTFAAYLRSDPSKRNGWSLTYSARENENPVGRELIKTDHSNNLNLQVSLMKNAHQQLRLNATYRQSYIDSAQFAAGQKADKSFLGRIEYFVNAAKGFISGNALYETGSGQEQKLDYSFYEVSAGQGQYTWIDYNHDGIQQLNEFEIAAFPDEARYIKIFTPTDVFVKANYMQLNYSLSINPKSLIGDQPDNKWAKFANRFSILSALQSGKKQLAGSGSLFDPFSTPVADTALLNMNYTFSNTLSFNRFARKWGLDITRLMNYHKSLLTYGSESTEIDEWNLKARVNIFGDYTIEWQQKFGSSNMKSPSFNNRNFTLNTMTAMPSVIYTRGTKWRLQAGYNYSFQKNAPEYGGERSVSNALNWELKYNAVQNTSITGQFIFNQISYTGTANSTVSYTMLQGLLPGKNFQWTINLTKRLLHNIEVNLQYQGRKPGDTRVINIGTASVRAIL